MLPMTKIKYLLILVFVFICSLTAFKLTHSYFSDTEKILGNSIQVGTWGVTPVVTPETTITPTPTEAPIQTPTPTPTSAPPVAGSVVINELMWMGSTESTADEWIELRNTTNQDIDLSNWELENVTAGGSPLIIPSGKTIPANGFFLIVNYEPIHPNSALKDTLAYDLKESNIQIDNNYQNNKAIILKDSYGNTIDSTPTPVSSNWPAGINGTGSDPDRSMERNSDPSTGWQTCTNDACNDMTYWDTEGSNYGTPKAANL